MTNLKTATAALKTVKPVTTPNLELGAKLTIEVKITEGTLQMLRAVGRDDLINHFIPIGLKLAPGDIVTEIKAVRTPKA